MLKIIKKFQVQKKYEKNNDYHYFCVENSKDSFRVFDEYGKYAYYIKLRENGTPDFKDHFKTPWNRYLKEIFDINGQVRKKLYMDENNKPTYSIIYNTKQKPIVSSVLDSKSNPKNFFYFPNKKQYYDEMDMAIESISNILETIEKPILFIDKREHVKYFNKIEKENLKKIYVLHSNHLDFPYFEINNFSPTVNDLFTSLNNGDIDKLIVLTKAQKIDILKVHNLKEKINVIPHHQPKIKGDVSEKNSRLIVSLARYHNSKNLKEAIEIINKVKKEIPNIIYNIYGYGPQKVMLANLIKELKLENNVFLKNHTNEPLKKLKGAKLSLMTSNYEGFCIAITEAMACGTPVVSYDTKYGPSEIIRSNIDGYIVKNQDMAAEKIIKILKMSDDEYNKLQKNALEVTDIFSEEESNKLWIKLLTDLNNEYELKFNQ